MSECIVLLGGSFDPVHAGHIAIAEHFCHLFRTQNLRLIPAGEPWQKPALHATPEQRVAMLQLAFETSPFSVFIDKQEIERPGPSYSIDTLASIRNETGASTSLVFIIGFDQLKTLPSWYQWQKLFDYAHIVAASRPGYDTDIKKLPENVQKEFKQRLSTPDTIRNMPSGLTYLDFETAIDISATEIRKNIRISDRHHSFVPSGVLDYILTKNLYNRD